MVTLLPFLSSYFCYLFMNSVSVVSMSHSRDKTKHLTYFSIRCFSQSRNPTPYKAHLCFNIYLKKKKRPFSLMRNQMKIFLSKILFCLLCLFLLIIDVHLGYLCILQKMKKQQNGDMEKIKISSSLFSDANLFPKRLNTF